MTAAQKHSPGPRSLWRGIAVQLEQDIIAGHLPSGSRLPTETALARQFGVNRHTLRRALAELTQKGFLRSLPQQGHVVAPLRVPFQIGPGTRLSDAISDAGFTATSKLLSERIVTPTPDIAKRLQIAQRTTVLEVTLVRYANGIPISYVTAWLPADRFANLGRLYEMTGSLMLAIMKAGVPALRRKLTRIVARVGTPEECTALGLDAGATLLTLEITNVDPNGEPVAVFLSRFSALRTEFLLEE